jgi:hypothetical protein
MKITINNKDYEMVFNYRFVKYVMKKNKWTNFSQYDAFLKKFAFDGETFGPEHLDLFGELVLLGISAGTDQKIGLKLDDILNLFWEDMGLLQEVTAYFIECQPKTKEVVDPVSRGN